MDATIAASDLIARGSHR